MNSAEPTSLSLDEGLRGAVCDAANRRFVEAWLGWRGAGLLMPSRKAVDIAEIRGLLGSVALFEIAGPDDIRVKVAGTQLREYTNFEATGMNFAAFTAPAQWPTRRYRMTQMASRPCGSVMTKFDRRTLGSGISFEVVTLPIEADEPGGARLLISCVTQVAGKFQPPTPDRQPVVLLSDHFDFLDIGAGTPARTEPSD